MTENFLENLAGHPKRQQKGPGWEPPEDKAYSPEEINIIEFIRKNKKNPTDIFRQLIKDKKIILVGEYHLKESEPIKDSVASSLLELQEQGLTHIGLEMDSRFQSQIDKLDYFSPNIKDQLKQFTPIGYTDGNLNVLVMAKQLGLNVVLVNYDDDRPESQKNNANYQNKRDEHMTNLLMGSLDKKSKCLVLIGSRHVHKSIVENVADGPIKRLGTRLSEKFGNDQVVSIRALNHSSHFDGLLSFTSKTPSVEDISPKEEGEVVVLPDSGPIKGNPRVTKSDFIITTIATPKINQK